MFLYALPFRTANFATRVLPAVGREDLDFIYSCLEIHPEYSEIICKLADIIQRASQIYLARARNLSEDIIAGLLQNFLTETATFNATSPGGHILIWPFFIVGTECHSPANQEFVESQLQTLWDYTGFGNTLYAIKILKDIWQSGFSSSSKTRLFNRVEGFIM